MARTACLVCFISTVNIHCNRKRKEQKKLTLGSPALVAGTQQTLSNLFWRLSISMVELLSAPLDSLSGNDIEKLQVLARLTCWNSN
jgi:hypothetical protein